MKLELTNFRCHQGKTFFLEDNAITLLHGDSGKGKTSIFKAINFALFGKEQRTTTFGQRKSKVVLTLDNIVISRTKTPNHLLVEVYQDEECAQRLEDAAAQGYIDSVFGTHFLQTCYLSQKCLDNFFTASRETRAELLRALSIQTFDINALKAKNKADIKDRKTLVVQSTATYTYAKKEFDARKFPSSAHVSPIFPLPKTATQTHTEVIEEYKKTNEENNKQYTTVSQSLKQLYTKLQNAQNSIQHLASTKMELATTEQSLTEIEAQLKSTENLNLKEKQTAVSTFQSELSAANAFLQRKEIEKKVEEEQRRFVKQQKEKLDSCKRKIRELSQDTDIEQELADTKEELTFCKQAKLAFQTIKLAETTNKIDVSFSKETFKDDVIAWCDLYEEEQSFREESLTTQNEQIETLQEQVSQYKQKIQGLEEQSKQQAHQCPSCKTSLAIVQGHIHAFDMKLIQQQKTKLEKEYKEYCSNLEKRKHELQTFQLRTKREKSFYEVCDRYKEFLDNEMDTIDEVIETNEQEIVRLTTIQKQLLKVKAEIDVITKSKSDIVSFLTSELEKLSNVCNTIDPISLRSIDEIEMDLESSKVELAECKKKMDAISDVKVQKATLQSRVKLLTKRLEDFTTAVQSIASIQEEIATSEIRLELCAKQQQEYNLMVDKLSTWKVAYTIYTEYKRCQENMEDAKNTMEVSSRGLTCALKMEKMIVDVESEALQAFLVELNAECEKHMQAMFDGEFALKVRYEKVGDEDSKKFYVDVDVYKNAEEVPYESLSGGESDRCALVLFLAFNKLSNGKMLLLDECLSSLHAEMVEDIVEHIKQEFSEKICVMTLHQTTKGIFDYVVNV